MPNALITGSGGRASDVAAALRSGGFEPVSADTTSHLVERCAATLPRSLDCYVQLPDDHPTRTTALAEASAMVAAAGMGRYEAVATVAPLLTDSATVVLVMGDHVADDDRSDLAGAMDGLTRVLARALRHDYRATAVRVILLEDRHSPSEIASIARRRDPALPVPCYLDFEPDLGFADWKLEVLSLTPAGT